MVTSLKICCLSVHTREDNAPQPTSPNGSMDRLETAICTIFILHDAFPSFIGPQYGLSLTLFTEDDEYIPALSSASGFRIVVQPSAYQPFPEDQGFTISPGLSTAVSLKEIKIRRMGLPYDSKDCGKHTGHDPHLIQYQHEWQHILDISNGSSIKTVNFTSQACGKGCYLQYLYIHCNCVDPYVVTPGHIYASIGIHARACNIALHDDLHCIRMKTLEINKLSICEVCMQSCNEQAYIPKITSGSWPRDQYINKIKGHWSSRLPNSDIANISAHNLKSQVAQITIYFEELNFQSIYESASMDLWDLASTIGGTLGLYGGLSFLTILEF